MEIKGITPKELLALSRSLNTRNTGFKPELSPVECGELLSKCVKVGNTVRELSDYFGYIHTKSINEFITIYKKINKNISHLIVFAEQDQYKRGLKYITYDKARIIAKYDNEDQESLAIATIDYGFSRYDLEGIKQRMERSGLSFKAVLDEFKKRKDAPIVTTLISFFLNDNVLKIMATEKGSKIFYKALESKAIINLFKENNKKLIQAKCSPSTYSLTISGGILTNEFKNNIDIEIEKSLLEHV